jgi:hypothetical protein
LRWLKETCKGKGRNQLPLRLWRLPRLWRLSLWWLSLWRHPLRKLFSLWLDAKERELRDRARPKD